MASAPVTSTTEVAPAIREFYDKNLLERALPNICLEKFGQRRSIKLRSGDKIKFRRYNAFATNIVALTEGTPPTGKQLSVTDITATLAQYGDWTKITDMVDMTNEDPVITEATDILGEQAGASVELTVLAVLIGGTAVAYSGGSSTATVANELKIADLQTAKLILLRNRAKTFTTLIKTGSGYGSAPVRPSFWAYTHPDMIKTLEAMSAFVPVEKYAAMTDVMPNEIGAIPGIRFVVSDLASVATDSGVAVGSTGCITSGTKINVYRTLIFGQNAFGVCPLGAKNFETIVKRSSGYDDPLNQVAATVAWKATIVTKILNDAWMYRIESGALA